MRTIDQMVAVSPVIPVLTFESMAQGEAVCGALYEGGIKVFEITLRTDIALKVVEQVKRIADDIVVGVGTITRAEHCQAAVQAGAQFGVSPGFTLELAAAAASVQLPWLPGVITPSDILTAMHAGYRTLKFFPANVAGGILALKTLHGPFPTVKFCPTGGITEQNAQDFLALPNVICVGGSWLTPKSALASQDWIEITRLARSASAFLS